MGGDAVMPLNPFNMATPVPESLPDPDNHSLSIYGSSVHPCQVPGPFPCRTHCSYFASHRLRNTPETQFIIPLPWLLLFSPPLTYFRRNNLKTGPELVEIPLPPPYLMSPKEKKKSFSKPFFLFPQPVMGTRLLAPLIPRTGQSGGLLSQPSRL